MRSWRLQPKCDRPASQIVREMMRDFVAKDKEQREYEAFYRRKVEKSLKSMEAGRSFTNEEVDAHMEALFAELERKSLKRRA